MKLENKTIAVTGATGMLGAYLCRALLEAGAKVRGVVRNPDKAPFLADAGVEFRRADLAEPDALAQAFEGADAVISNAALYRWYRMSLAENMRTNLAGTENVYRAAASAGVKRMVQISSFGIYRWGLARTPIMESSKQLKGDKGQGGGYRASKQASEVLAFKLSTELGLSTTAVQPGAIYGARDQNLTPYFDKLMKLPFLPVPNLKAPFVYAGDVADAVVGALRNDESVGQSYLTAGRCDSVVQFLRAYSEAKGAGTKIIPMTPTFGLRADCGKAQRDLGFENHTFIDGLTKTAAEDAGQLLLRRSTP